VTDSAGQKLAYVYFEDAGPSLSDRPRVFDKGQARPFLDQLLNSNCRELGVKLRSYSAMQRDIELIFPIKDVASAALMTIKADCLHKAGIINEAEKQHVHSRARTFLDDATLKDAA
jgi:hypothetical protein